MRNKTILAFLAGVLLLALAGCGFSGKEEGKKTSPKPDELKTVELKDVILPDKIVDLSGYNNDIKLSPDGRSIAFSGYYFDEALQTQDSILVLVDLTNEETRTYNGPFRVLDWLKDGKGILYSTDNSIGLLDIQNGEKKEIEKVFTYACLSPDGKKVAYTVRGKMFSWDTNALPEGQAGLWLYDIATGNKKQLTNKADEWYPVWFPDGSRIFYFCDLGKDLGDGAGHLQGMATISMDGGQPEIMPQKDGKFRKAQWIVPGKSLYILEGWDDGYANSILNLEDGKYVSLDEGSYGPGLSSEIVIDSKAGRLVRINNGQAEIIDVSGKVLGSFTMPEEENATFNFSVSPRGEVMAYVQGEFGRMLGSKVKGNVIELISLDGSNPRLLTTEYKYNESVIWDREGKNVITLQMERANGKENISAIKVLPVE